MSYLIQPPSSQPGPQQQQQPTLGVVDSLVVSELPGECKELDLLMLAQSYGRVKSCEIKRDFRNHVISVYGILNYYTIESAEAAYRALHGASYMGKVLRASWMPRNQSNPNLNNSSLPQPTAKGSRTAQVHISYLSKQLNFIISEQFLRDIFGNFGNVLEIALKKTCVDPEMSVQNGYGFVHYPLTPEGINSALMAVQNLHQVTINQITFDCSVSNQLNQILMSMERNNQRNNNFQQQPSNFNRGRGSMFPQQDIGHGGGRGSSFAVNRGPYIRSMEYSNPRGLNYPSSAGVAGPFHSHHGALPHQMHGSDPSFDSGALGKSSTYLQQQPVPMPPQQSNNYSNVPPPSTYAMPPASSPRDQLYHTKSFSNMDYRAVPPPPSASMSNLESTYATQSRHIPNNINEMFPANVEDDLSERLSDSRLSDNLSRASASDGGFGMAGNVANSATMGKSYVHHVPSFNSDSSGSVPTLNSANPSLTSTEFSTVLRDPYKKKILPTATASYLSLPDNMRVPNYDLLSPKDEMNSPNNHEPLSPSGDGIHNNTNFVDGVKHDGEVEINTNNNNGTNPTSYSMW